MIPAKRVRLTLGLGTKAASLAMKSKGLSENTRDMHRAIITLMEELEAVDWYNQRIDVCVDNELKAILIHNRGKKKSMPRWCLNGSVAKTTFLTKSSKTFCFLSVRLHTNSNMSRQASRLCA